VNAFAKAAKAKSVSHPSEVFYSQGGFGALLNAATKHGNPNENYYFVVNAPAGNKTAVRPASVYQQFAAAPNIHPVVEFNKAAWNKLPGTWQQKGREFRQEMTAAGLPANTMWAVNEAGSGIRAKSPAARRQMSALTTALSQTGSGKERGIVLQQGPGYKQGLGNEMADNKFWSAMKNSVWRYMPETYISPKSYLQMQEQQRQQYLFGADKGHAHGEFGPMMSAFWGANKGYGNTKVPLPEMQKFVAAQLAEVRAKGQPVYGMAWNGAPAGMKPAAVAALANAIVR